MTVFPPGATLCVQGEPATHLFILLAGWVKVLSASREGGEVMLALRGHGDVIGEMAGQLDGYRTATVRAAVRTEALAVISERFASFLGDRPGADRAFHRAIARRSHESDASLRERAGTSGAQRLARRLLDLGGRCGEVTEQGTAIAVPLSQAELASWIGVTRATVTRALQQWRGRGLVRTVGGRITVADPAGLRRVAGLPPPGPGTG
ncbi:MAG: Crp/Fnr family transcriptional regulator [Actinobacteria bacterium]|nr:Crp/Fnr family transcriptional regulator [Actinomycetota bacterium]